MTGVDLGAFLAALSVTRVVGMGVLGFGLGGLVSLLYRTYLAERVPLYVPVIVGLGAVGLWMNTASAIVQFVESTSTQEPLVLREMETNVVAIGVGGVGAFAGARVGDRLAPNLRALTGAKRVDTEVSKLVRTVGRFITVTVPKAEDIGDISGYEPVAEETKAKFAGRELLFPRGLTLAELRDRLVDRLREDYGVGYVDVELGANGTIDYLAVGSRAAGIGPTLPPRRAVVAVTADPAPNASPGDRVRLWRSTDDGAESITTAELRAANGDVATLAMDTRRTSAISQSESYNLVTLSAGKQPEKEFAALLRTANETMGSTVVEPNSTLVGMPVGALKPAVVAIRPAEGKIETLPGRTRVCEAGDTIYAIGRPDELRKLEAIASAPASG